MYKKVNSEKVIETNDLSFAKTNVDFCDFLLSLKFILFRFHS